MLHKVGLLQKGSSNLVPYANRAPTISGSHFKELILDMMLPIVPYRQVRQALGSRTPFA
jgi:hypothetical protein